MNSGSLDIWIRLLTMGIFGVLAYPDGHSQNLVPNPSFEDISFCPESLTDWSAEPWYPVTGTADNFHACASPIWEGVPTNFQGFQYAHQGDGYAGGYFDVVSMSSYREFLQVPLIEALQAGHCYEVGCWINLSDESCASNRMGFLFTPGPETNLMGMTPDIDIQQMYLADTVNWTYVSGTYFASGNEAYLSIGNFLPVNGGSIDPACTTPVHYVYYYVDDVVVQELVIAEQELDLGPPVTACDSYTIDPGFAADAYEWSDGSQGSSLTVATSGTYSVTAYSGCTPYVGSLDVTIILPGSLDLGPGPLEFCTGSSLALQLDPAFETYLWSDGSVGPEIVITTPGYYSVTLEDGCHVPIIDGIYVDEFFPPELNLGEDVYLCPGDVIVYEFDPGLGDFLWEDGTTGPDYYIESEGGYALTISNICGTVSDAIEVFSVDLQALDLGPPVAGLCPGDTLVLSGPGGYESYTWQDGSIGSMYEVTASGSYSLTVTSICGVAMDSVEVMFGDVLAAPNLGPDVSLCPGQQLVLTVNSAGGTAQWSDMSTADTLLVTAAETYSVQVSNACFNYADTVVVTVNSDPPAVSLPADYALCAGARDTLDAMVTGVSYVWSDGTTMQQLPIDAPGTYAVTVSNACGMDSDTVIVTAGEPVPMVELGPDTSLCMGDILTITPVSSDVTMWLWQDGSTLPTFSAQAPAVVAVRGSSTCGVAADTVVLALLPATPDLDLGPDMAICAGETVILAVGASGVDIVWSDGTTGSTLVVSQAGTYHALITDACGMSADTVIVDPLPLLPVPDLGPDQTICPGETVVIDPMLGTDVSYAWDDGSTGMTYAATQGGWIVLTITNACGTATDSLLLTATTDGPQLDLGPDRQACTGETVTIAAGIAGVSYQWSDGTSGSSLIVTGSGSYSLTVSNACGTDSDTVNVGISGQVPDMVLGPDTTLCEAETLVLTVTADAETTVTWQDNTTGTNYLVTIPGTYAVQASNRCGTDGDSIDIEYIIPPGPFTLGPDTVLCLGQSVVLEAPLTLDEIEWQDGSTEATYVADQEGTYVLRVSNRCGIAADSLAVFVLADEPMVDLGPERMWCPGDTFVLDATQPFPAQYRWNTGATTPTLLAMQPGVYRVDVSTPCVTAEGKTAIAEEEDCFPAPEIYVPNVFSPNGDGINDVFTIVVRNNLEVLGMEGAIYDRWGDLVHQSRENPFTWDGDFKGVPMNPAVYVYVITVRYRINDSDMEFTLSGDVTIVH